MASSDLAGTWQYLGTITPTFDTWQRFPTATNSSNVTIRLTFYDDGNFTKIGSLGYIRPVFVMPEVFYGTWRRIYPSNDRLILRSAIPEEILYASDSIIRYFEVSKRAKAPRSGWRVHDSSWSVAIESLELIALTEEQQALLEQANAIEDAATVIRNLLNG